MWEKGRDEGPHYPQRAQRRRLALTTIGGPSPTRERGRLAVVSLMKGSLQRLTPSIRTRPSAPSVQAAIAPSGSRFAFTWKGSPAISGVSPR